MEFGVRELLLEELLKNKELSVSQYLNKQQELGGVADWNYPCLDPSVSSEQWCNTSLSFADRAWDLTNNLTIDEMAGLTQNGAHSVDRLNIPFYEWWNEALHGLAGSPGIGWNNPNYASGYPQVIVTASSFNRSLWHKIGDAISTDARSFNNNKQAGLTFWAPNVNIYRDPRWGRGQETPGEDPFINGEYAAYFVSAFQGNDDKYLKASACCKHFAGYSMEDSDGKNRHNFNAIISDYDLNDTYFPAFKSCVKRGKASAVMCAYNAVNGIPSCADSFLLTETLRNDWGFYGYVTSDCGAVKDVYDEHHYTDNWYDTVNVTLSAGMDLDCGSVIEKYSADAISDGVMSESTLRRAVYDLILVQMRLGMFDDPSATPWADYSGKNVATKEALALSMEASQQGTVLLKNDGFLPINWKDQIKDHPIAIIGAGLGSSRVQAGSYQGFPPYMVSLRDAFDFQDYSHSQEVFFAQGYSINGEDDEDTDAEYDAAVAMVEGKDLIILGVGLEQSLEREGTDRKTLNLPTVETSLAAAVLDKAHLLGIPVVMVVYSGGCVDITSFLYDSRVSAIIWAGYGGMYGGYAVMDLMLGRANPVGRLTQTWYSEPYMNEVEMIDMRMQPNSTDNYPGRGYRYYNGNSIVLPFGYGMSYVSFDCYDLSFDASSGEVSFTITNLGSKDYLINSYNNSVASAAVLVYWVPTQPSTLQKRLVAFEQVSDLKEGSDYSQTVVTPVYSEFMLHQEYADDGDFVLSGACDKE